MYLVLKMCVLKVCSETYKSTLVQFAIIFRKNVCVQTWTRKQYKIVQSLEEFVWNLKKKSFWKFLIICLNKRVTSVQSSKLSEMSIPNGNEIFEFLWLLQFQFSSIGHLVFGH